MNRTEYVQHVDQKSMEIRSEFLEAGVDLNDPAQRKAADVSVLWVLMGLKVGLDNAEKHGLTEEQGADYALTLVAEALPFFGAAIGKSITELLDAGWPSLLLDTDDDE